ncbi:MAG: 1-deoxy-D-xylulose-5-phosphate reductoisomerase [Lachnospiraceae bacterium]|nr:1-deoxy-D-xylulose-5-phosphate reductoisomerase [Lachnospiraceae bacterium]
MKKVSILGSSGSIGTQTLDVIRAYPEDFKVVALAVDSSIDVLSKQIQEFSPEMVCVYDEKRAADLRKMVGNGVEVVSGMDGLVACAVIDSADIVMCAVVGMIGVRPVIEAVSAGKDIALANKESLVTAGHIIMPLAKEKGISVLPVDSEHSAIFQSLQGQDRSGLAKIILTASGGPFRGKTPDELKSVTVSQALSHPNWSMGKKITIDSATMVNKGLELMEARWLFDVDIDRIQILIQPQSVIHSMVEYDDGAVIAQLGTPDMRLPIQYALFYPRRMYLEGERVDFYSIGRLDFEKPDMNTFEGLRLAIEAAKTGGSMPTVYNAANECAVAEFLAGRIGFTDIPRMIKDLMDSHQVIKNPDVDTVVGIGEEIFGKYMRTERSR